MAWCCLMLMVEYSRRCLLFISDSTRQQISTLTACLSFRLRGLGPGLGLGSGSSLDPAPVFDCRRAVVVVVLTHVVLVVVVDLSLVMVAVPICTLSTFFSMASTKLFHFSVNSSFLPSRKCTHPHTSLRARARDGKELTVLFWQELDELRWISVGADVVVVLLMSCPMGFVLDQVCCIRAQY